MLKEYYTEAEAEYTSRIETLTKKLAAAEAADENATRIQSEYDNAKKEWSKTEIELKSRIDSLTLELEMVQNKVSSLEADIELQNNATKSSSHQHTRTSSQTNDEIENLKQAMVKSDQAHTEHMESLRGNKIACMCCIYGHVFQLCFVGYTLHCVYYCLW